MTMNRAPQVDELVNTYLRALGSGDSALAISLFTSDGSVHSPLYGEMAASDFYPTLFAHTAQSTLRLRKTLHSAEEDDRTIGFWFDFDWTLADGVPAPFTVLDVAELNDDGLITDLHIVYDTHPIRASWEKQRKNTGNLA